VPNGLETLDFRLAGLSRLLRNAKIVFVATHQDAPAMVLLEALAFRSGRGAGQPRGSENGESEDADA
jgi:hypothetical protein